MPCHLAAVFILSQNTLTQEVYQLSKDGSCGEVAGPSNRLPKFSVRGGPPGVPPGGTPHGHEVVVNQCNMTFYIQFMHFGGTPKHCQGGPPGGPSGVPPK